MQITIINLSRLIKRGKYRSVRKIGIYKICRMKRDKRQGAFNICVMKE